VPIVATRSSGASSLRPIRRLLDRLDKRPKRRCLNAARPHLKRRPSRHPVGEPVPPLRQYFARVSKKRQTSALLPPKGRGFRTLTAFRLQTSHFQGTVEGASSPILDPWAGELVGEAHAPLWQYFPLLRESSLPPRLLYDQSTLAPVREVLVEAQELLARQRYASQGTTYRLTPRNAP
jgi:hypothetical protein